MLDDPLHLRHPGGGGDQLALQHNLSPLTVYSFSFPKISCCDNTQLLRVTQATQI